MLEGIGLIRKGGKNRIKWVGSAENMNDSLGNDFLGQINIKLREKKELIKSMEANLDDLICKLTLQ